MKEKKRFLNAYVNVHKQFLYLVFFKNGDYVGFHPYSFYFESATNILRHLHLSMSTTKNTLKNPHD